MRRRTAIGLGLATTVGPPALAEQLRDAAAEAMEFTRRRAASSVGAGTIDQLTSAIAELDRVYEWEPATNLFPVARFYRHRVATLLDGQHTLAEARELYVYAAHLSYLLGDLAHDLGSYGTAQAYAIDSYDHAEQADHTELCAWASSSLSFMLLLAGHTTRAIDAAERGIAKAPESSAIGARLRARAARAHARRGDRATCLERLREARDLCDRLPEVSLTRLSTEDRAFTAGKIAEHSAYCQVWLGDYAEAERHARSALSLATYSPGAAGLARIDLAISLANLGSPEEAVDHATQAFAVPRFLGGLLPRVRELSRTLTSRYSSEPCVQDFNDRYQQLASQALIN
jgi:tetratricopeptide (TPR) repeat protein